MADTIDNLVIEISASADAAVRSIDRLNSAIRPLGGASRTAAHGMEVLESETEKANSTLQRTSKDASLAGNGVKGAGKDMEEAGKAAKKGTVGISSFWGALKRIAFYRFVRSIIRSITDAFKTGITNLYQWSSAVNGTFAKSMDKIATSTLYLKNSLGTLAAPLIESLAPVIDYLVDGLVEVINLFNMFIAAISGKTSYTAAIKTAKTWGDSVSNSAKGAKASVDELKRTILGFDEINKLDKQNTSAGNGGYGNGNNNSAISMFEQRPIVSAMRDVTNSLSTWVSSEIGKINAIIDVSAMALGLILATHGQLPIGLGLMAMGALDMGASIVAYSDTLSPEIKAIVAGILGIAGIAFVVGAIFAFSGGNIPLGIGLMAAGIGAISGSYKIASVNWDSISEILRGPIGTAVAVVSGAALVLGILALLCGAVPIGLGLILSGAAGLATTIAANWGNLEELGKNAIEVVKKGWDTLKDKAFQMAVNVINDAKKWWSDTKKWWNEEGRDKVIEFAAKLRDTARTWWQNLKTWWNSEGKDKIIDFAAKIRDTARTWWQNVKTWWNEEGRDKVIDFAAKVRDTARTWWQNVKTWWNTEGKQELIDFAVRVRDTARAWWQNVKTWWESEGKNKVIDFAAKLRDTAKTWWQNLKTWWNSEGKNKVIDFAAKIRDTAKTWWQNLKTWWESEGKDKLIDFAVKLRDTARTWWQNLKTWWDAEGKDKLIDFAVKVRNTARTWWQNVKTWWESEGKNKVIDFAAKLRDTAKTWWQNLKTWWNSEGKNKVIDFAAKIRDTAKTWWQNLKTWWESEGKDKLIDFAVKLRDTARTWWQNLKTWWDAEGKDKLIDFAVKVRNTARTWWQNVKTWWDAEGKNHNLAFIPIVIDAAKTWWKNVSDWWDTEGKNYNLSFYAWIKDNSSAWWLNVKTWWNAKVGPVKEFFTNVKNTASTWWSDVKKFWDDYIVGKALNAVANISVIISEKVSQWFKEFWNWLTGYGEEILPQGVAYGEADVTVNAIAGDGMVYSWEWGFVPDVSNTETTVWVDSETEWGFWGESLSEWLGIDKHLRAVVDVVANVNNISNTVSNVLGGLSSGGVVTPNGIQRFASGGSIANGHSSWWDSVPKYGNGTRNAHGTLFVAGEAGPEIVGHVGGRTEVLNKSQLASAMYSAVNAAMQGMTLDANFYGGNVDGDINGESLAEMMEYMRADADAMRTQNDLLRQQNELLRQINEKDLEISTSGLNRAQQYMNRRAGTTIVPVGT